MPIVWTFRSLAIAALASAIFLAAASASPASALATDRELCLAGQGDDNLAACTRAIDAGQWHSRDLAAVYVSRGRAYAARIELGRALSDFNQAIRADASYAAAYDGRGLFFKFYPARAIADYDEAIRLDPNDAAFRVDRGAAYRTARDFDRALADANEAIRIDATNAAAYRLRGSIDRDRGDLDRAIDDYGEAIRFAPGDKYAYFDRGTGFQAKGDLDRAIADYDQTIKRGPFTRAYEVRASAFAAKGDLDRAVADYDEAIRRVPDDAAAFRGRGLARQAKGDAAGGAADLARARQLSTIAGLPVSIIRVLFLAIGAIAILCGALTLCGMLRSRRMPTVTALFFASTVLAGLLLPQASIAPMVGTIIIGLVAVVVALVAYYVGRLAGHWRWIYVIAVVATLYLEAYVALAEALVGLPSLLVMLPRTAEPPFVPLQVAVIGVFVALGATLLRLFRPQSAAPAQGHF